jgi:hypothetical protein
MTGYTCPHEGCDYQADQIDQLRGHVNGSPDHPDWGDLDAGSELVEQNDQQETTPSEGAGSPDEDGDADQPDDPPEPPSEEGNEGGGSAGSETDDQPDDQNDQQDTPMPTDDELQRQRRVQGAEPDESGTDEEPSSETTPEGGSKAGTERGTPAGLFPAIDTSTIIMLVAVVVVILVAYRLVSGDGDEGSDEVEQEDINDDQEDEDGLDNFDATELEDLG